jgi:hypothetical protein
MRVTSQIWVSAHLRRCAALGIAAVVARRGDASAGAIFVKLSLLDGTALLFAPAPQTQIDAAERRWQPWQEGRPQPESDIDARLAREHRFDPDIWVVEVEDREGRHLLEDQLVSEAPPQAEWPPALS